MKRTLKKSMSILLAFTLLFGSLAFGFSDMNWSDFAVKVKAEETAETFTEGYYTYTVDENGNAMIIAVDSSVNDNVIIPSTLGGHKVTEVDGFSGKKNLIALIIPDSVICIGDSAFASCDNLTSVTIGNSVTSIGERAFGNCSSLTSVAFPESVICIGERAFENCYKLTNVTFGNYITNIGYAAFSSTGIYKDETNWKNDALYIGDYLIQVKNSIEGSYSIKEGTRVIANYAFCYCSNLENVEIPDSVTFIDCMAFYIYTVGLTSITVDSANTTYSNDEYGVLFNKNKTELIYYPRGNARTIYLIPGSVTRIGNRAFYGCRSLANITIPDCVTSIGDAAFGDCPSLTSVTICNGVKTIGDSAFIGCSKLEFVHIPSTVTSIGNELLIYTDAYICSNTENCYAKTYSDENDIEFKLCDNHGVAIPEETTTVPKGTTKPVEVPTTHQPVVTEPATTKPVKVPNTTKPAVTEPSTTKPVEVPTTTKPAETEPTTKPAETEPSTKPVEVPATKPIETTKPTTTAPTTKPEPVEDDIIKKPSTTEVKYGETLILHADFENIPADAKIEWSVDGEGVTIEPSADGKTCAVTSTATGDVTITAKYVDENGVEHVSEQEIESNASFWQKIVSFFKNLFGMNRIIEQKLKF